MGRKTQILQALAQMLEHPHGDRVTTAALAAHMGASEAGLYRHFASKAQMFDGLIDLIESGLLPLADPASADAPRGGARMRRIIAALLAYGERNRGLTRLLIGDALVVEDGRLQERINHIIDRLETSIEALLRRAQAHGEFPPDDDVVARANLIVGFVLGRWHRYAKSGWRQAPTQRLEPQLAILLHAGNLPAAAISAPEAAFRKRL